MSNMNAEFKESWKGFRNALEALRKGGVEAEDADDILGLLEIRTTTHKEVVLGCGGPDIRIDFEFNEDGDLLGAEYLFAWGTTVERVRLLSEDAEMLAEYYYIGEF